MQGFREMHYWHLAYLDLNYTEGTELEPSRAAKWTCEELQRATTLIKPS